MPVDMNVLSVNAKYHGYGVYLFEKKTGRFYYYFYLLHISPGTSIIIICYLLGHNNT